MNKQSALFLSRKRRLETINEVLEKFAVEITSLETASKVRELLYRNENGSDCEVVITVKIRGDQRMPNAAVASIEARLSSRLSAEAFNGLR